ncbi:hypothetical protein Har1130_00970 [Haloarcula sp. CBA1130]|uniref:DUF5781 family protein n=1 Tax=unclassified Haloarcula TaxID=2624677 RepID=UPI001244CEA3|nr:MULTISPECIES: DUF5781 family protein [unclassified Haloarcula]KAA9399656.1 hypothetical protein Har1129_16090 [Haloarcula sp. CBA1129]KAA9401380.1 hypothetical protein Har1130_00970 [Haloarcula sp. CBA1130]
MDVHVQGGPAEPFLGARDLFSTEHDLNRPVTVRVREDPDERTRVSHSDDAHKLTISRQAATSAMARELALHEYAHMRHHERGHPSHTQSTREAIYLALAGHSVEQRKLTHCYQIANHMKDVYADDIWMPVVPGDKLVPFLEASLAAAVADRPGDPPAWGRSTASTRIRHHSEPAARLTPAADPDITAVNAAFALALCERHELVDSGHRLYDLAHAAAQDAESVDITEFKRHFAALSPEPDESEFRKALVDVTRAYAGDGGGRAAD